MAVLLDSYCSHYMMGTKAVFVAMAPSDDVKHVRGFNGALQPVEGHGIVALQGEAEKRVLIPDMLYVLGVQANLLSAGQLKEQGVQLQGDGDEMLLVAATGEVLGRARYNGRVLCTDLRPCSTRLSSTKSTGENPPYVSCVKGKLARHTFPDKGSDAEEALAVMHIDFGLMPRMAAWEFLGKEFTDFVDGKGIVHDLTCPYTPQQNGMAEREMRMASMYQLLTGKNPDLTLAQVWGCMVQFMVLEQQHGGKLASKARWGLHLGVSPESKGWEVLDLTNNKVVTSVEVIFYETLSLEVCKAKYGPASGRTQAHPPTDTSTATVPLLAEVDKPADEDIVEVLPPSPVLAPPSPVADRPALTSLSATGDEGSLEASPMAPASGIAGGRQGAKLVDQDGKPSTTGEQQIGEPVEQEAATGVQSTGEQQTGRTTGELSKSAGGEQLVEGSKQLVDDLAVDEEGELSAGEYSTDSDMVEVPITKPELRRTGRARQPPERLSFHACLPLAAFTTVYDKVGNDLLYDDAEEDEDLSELDPHKGEAVKAAMEEEIRSLIGKGTWELVELTRGVNIMKNQWVLTTKYRIDDTVKREKARLVVKGFTQVCGADYDETYSPSLYGLKLSPLLWYRALDGVLLGAGWKKSQVDEVLYFKAGDNRVTCWVLVYVDDLLAASRSPAMLKELKELLEAAFELRKISPVVKNLGLEIVRDKPARKLWLHLQGYADKLRRRFIDEEQGGRVPKMLVSVDAYAELTFNDEEAQEREEEEYRHNVGSLQFAATTMRPDIAFACSKLGSCLTVRSDQHWHEVDRCLTYLADTRDTALEFGGGPELLELIGYVDVDDASDKQKQTSTGGYVFIFGGVAISWSSSRSKCATLSLTKSEYVAAMDAGKEGCRLCFLLAEFKLLDAGKPTILRVDNKSAFTVAEGLGLTGNLKHMERRYAWLQHMVRRGKFVLKYIPTTEQPADFLTKALHFLAFNRCSDAIGQVRQADVGDGDDDVQK
ncbi:unnamed protein product [Closterium sp. NIES-53]